MTWHVATEEDGPYYGEFATREDAIAEGIAADYEVFWVGESRLPKALAEGVFADEVVEKALENLEEDWMPDVFDWEAKPEQLKTLQEELRLVVDRWIEQYRLQPTWFLIGNPERIENP